MATIETRWRPIDGHEAAALVEWKGTIDDGTVHFAIRSLAEVRAAGHTQIVLDLAAVGHAGSPGLAFFAITDAELREQGGGLAVIGARAKWKIIFELLGIALPVRSDHDAAAALAMLDGG